ncbi:MAG: hypothetical protein HY247_03635 [archaeon]|nr:MAG: hypothetical protein HY247_03635 [archaeon]
MNVPPDVTPDLAEVIGLHLGDGCLSRRLHGRHESNVVAFTAHKSEFWYYEEFVKPTMETTFGVSGRLYLRNDNTTRYHINDKELVTYLSGLGLPIGKKADAMIPRVIFKKGYTSRCIRGVYHAEGSLYRRYSKAYNQHARVYDNLLSLQIRMKLKTLMNQIHDELIRFGILCNRLTEKHGVYTLRVTSQLEIAKFMEVIGPRYKSTPPPITL